MLKKMKSVTDPPVKDLTSTKVYKCKKFEFAEISQIEEWYHNDGKQSTGASWKINMWWPCFGVPELAAHFYTTQREGLSSSPS